MIELHQNFRSQDPVLVHYLKALVELEAQGRQAESHAAKPVAPAVLGHENGPMREYFNRLLEKELDWSSPLLDLGCGGSAWKEFYWPKLPGVTGVEVNRAALESLRQAYPDSARYRLIQTTTGLTELPDESFSQILSSSVLGYILPRQAEAHLRECWRLLKPGGRLILTRVKASTYQTLKTGPLMEIPGRIGGFEVDYSRGRLLALVAATCPSYRLRTCRKMGMRVPGVSVQFMQKLYAEGLGERLDPLVTSLIPAFGIHHLVIVEKASGLNT